MRERHGTPKQFEEALYPALGEITWGEMVEALDSYKQDYEAAPEE